MDLAKGRWGVRKNNRRGTCTAWIKVNQMNQTVRVCGPARWAHDVALANVEKLLAASHEDLPRVVSDLKNAAKMKKKICVEKTWAGLEKRVEGLA